MRPSGRTADQLREVSLETGVSRYAEGSCLAKFGQTHVLCTASVEDKVPGFLKGKGQGWLTAEYGMLPRSTHERMRREASQGKQSGRTQEIQRLIGRSLRSVAHLPALGERTIWIDCDVIQADGGTRTASITGSYVALVLALRKLGLQDALTGQVAAVSVGMKDARVLVDLDYNEDSSCDVDMNFVMLSDGTFVELQGTAEHKTFTRQSFMAMTDSAETAIRELHRVQKQILG